MIKIYYNHLLPLIVKNVEIIGESKLKKIIDIIQFVKNERILELKFSGSKATINIDIDIKRDVE